MNSSKEMAFRAINEKEKLITSVSDRIWEYAELSLKEEKSCACYVDVLKQEGFEVVEGLCGIPTAFSASYGHSRPVIGILAEYDALSGLSQIAGSTEQSELIPGGNGHGCGHNMLGAGALAAAIGIKEYLSESGREGTVILYGCPGEEGWASKAYMAREGIWRDLDAALTWHPEDSNEVAVGRTNACLSHLYTFKGIASHAAGAPEKGRSALDAVELMNIGVQFLREHMKDGQRVHYAITNAGGVSPNVVQAEASVLYFVRSSKVYDAIDLQKRLDDIAKGAALMTGTSYEKTFVDGLADTVANTVLEQVLYDNFCQIGVPEYTAEEKSLADTVHATYSSDGYIPGLGSEDPDFAKQILRLQSECDSAMNAYLNPLYKKDVFRAGSTDVGDVSYLTPTAQIHVSAWPNGTPGHSWQIVSLGKSSIVHKALLTAGKVIAAAAIDLYEKPDLVAKAREEFNENVTGKYVCPFPPEATPSIVL